MVFSNYRPAVLPVFSKVIERLMYNRLFDFINENRLLYKYQFGFQKGKSTSMALIMLVDRISEALEKGEYVIGVFLDFSKAFDTVDHQILIEKLKLYGINGTEIEWFKDYLHNRTQYVTYNGEKSTSRHITCGVPQGSILGPLLFLIYINDLSTVSKDLFSILFADDSNMFIAGKNINDLSSKMNLALKDIQEWLCANKLSLNVLKTHYMVFTTQRKVVPDIKLVIFNSVIERVYVTKFLGVQIDSKLNWKDHIKYIRKKLSKSVGIMYKARKKLTKPSLINLYYSIANPHFIYCNQVWGNAHKTILEPMHKIQKKFIRIITSSPYRAHTQPLFVANHMLDLYDINNYMSAIFMYNVLRTDKFTLFSSFYTLNNEVHDHDTRTAHDVHVPFARKCVRRFSIKIHGALVWNNIPDAIRNSDTPVSFKRAVKKFYIDRKIMIV